LAVQGRITLIVIARTRVLAAIGLDDQPGFDASEIDDVGRDGELPTKAPSQPATTQLTPERVFGISQVSAQVPSEVAH
jgi:hypothetical protein